MAISLPIGELLRALDGAPPFQLPNVLGDYLARATGALSTDLLLADYSEISLQRVGGGAQPVSIEGGPEGEAYRTRSVVTRQFGDTVVIDVPIGIRSDRQGVMAVQFASQPPEETVEFLGHVATAVAYVIIGATAYTDLFERTRRRRTLQLPAEMQWSLLPIMSYEAPDLRLSGAIEPAYEIGGDNFDYSVERTHATLTIADAMGHGLRAALLTDLCVSAFRNTRRRDGSLVDQADAANAALNSQFPDGSFVTCLLVGLDLERRTAEVVNAGHHPPMRVRAGEVEQLRPRPRYPLGPFEGATYVSEPLDFRPGDRLVLFSDGVTEVAPDGGQPWGLGRFTEFVRQTRELQPNEVVRRATRAVIDYRRGDLRDDATVLCVDWLE